MEQAPDIGIHPCPACGSTVWATSEAAIIEEETPFPLFWLALAVGLASVGLTLLAKIWWLS